MCDTYYEIQEDQDHLDMNGITVQFLREQRHDFMNHIQVIWGYLQIGKTDQAMRYIKDMNKSLDVYGRILRLGDPSLSLFLYKVARVCDGLEINMDFDCEFGTEDMHNFMGRNYIEKIDATYEVCHHIIKNYLKERYNQIYIDLFMENSTLYIVLSGSPYGDGIEQENNEPCDSSIIPGPMIDMLCRLGIGCWCKKDGNDTIIKMYFEAGKA